jgi:hypothetical protein
LADVIHEPSGAARRQTVMKTLRTLLHALCLTILFVTHADALNAKPIPGMRRAVERLSDAQFGSLPVSELGLLG